MNRNEWVTLAFTLVGAGGTYFVTQKPLWALAALGLGLVIMLGLFLFDRPKEASTARPLNEVRKSLNPVNTNTATASPVQNVNLNFPQTQEARPPVASKPKPKPNIQFLRAQTMRLVFGDDEAFYENKYRNSSEGLPGIVACFRNDALETRAVPKVYNVKGQLIYRRGDGEEVGEGVGAGCWLEERTDAVDFPLGEARYLVMMIKDSRSLYVPRKGRRKFTGRLACIIREKWRSDEFLSKPTTL